MQAQVIMKGKPYGDFSACDYRTLVTPQALEVEMNEGYQVGNVYGTYLHGCFNNDSFRTAFLNRIRIKKELPTADNTLSFKNFREGSYRQLAEALRSHLDLT